MICLIICVALAGEDMEQAAEEAAEQREDVEAVTDDLHVMSAYLRDEHLISAGLVPLDWAQPSYEVYESELAGRPSMLPMIAFVEAAQKAELDPALVVEYVAWTAARTTPVLPGQQVQEAQLQVLPEP